MLFLISWNRILFYMVADIIYRHPSNYCCQRGDDLAIVTQTSSSSETNYNWPIVYLLLTPGKQSAVGELRMVN